MVIYKTVPVVIEQKIWHRHKINKKLHRDFTTDYGDIPVARINPITGNIEEVVNNRGFGYACRNRKKYRR